MIKYVDAHACLFLFFLLSACMFITVYWIIRFWNSNAEHIYGLKNLFANASQPSIICTQIEEASFSGQHRI